MGPRAALGPWRQRGRWRHMRARACGRWRTGAPPAHPAARATAPAPAAAAEQQRRRQCTRSKIVGGRGEGGRGGGCLEHVRALLISFLQADEELLLLGEQVLPQTLDLLEVAGAHFFVQSPRLQGSFPANLAEFSIMSLSTGRLALAARCFREVRK